MGRSKFPGKPSKSINRKRISVLQLEDDAAAAGTSAAEQEDGLTTAAAATNVGGGAGKRNNCDDDDERRKGGGGGGGNSGAGGAGGVAGGGSSASNTDSGGSSGDGGTQNNRNVNGNGNTNTTSNGSASGNGSVRSAGHATTAAAATSAVGDNNKASTAAGDGNDSSSTATTTTTTTASQQNADSTDNGKKNRQENANDADVVADVEADSAAADDMSTVARQARVGEEQIEEEDCDDNDNGDDEDEDDEDEEDDNASSTSRKSLQSACSSASSTGSSTSFSGSGGSKSSNRKFKNLNLAKPEVMLPSSAKIRLQQELNCPSPASPAMNPFAIAETTANANDNDDNSGEAGGAVGGDGGVAGGSASHNCSDAAKLHKNVAEMLATNTSTNKPIDSSATADSSSANNESKTAATAVAGSSPSLAATTAASKQKKTVTFKNILETSDDKSAVKKFYNPDNRIPLVSIMKKECMNRPLTYSRSGECIVRPSRLTEILKNNSNIDKLNSLKFRTATATATATSPAAAAALSESSTSAASTSSLFGANLSRAFGAPAYEADHKHDSVTFRVSDAGTAVTNGLATDDGETTAGGDADASAERGLLEKEEQEPTLTDEGEEDDEQQMIVDKHFVLPKRSTRSSRVIKPNKRLLEDGIICKKTASAKTKPPAVVGTAAVTAGGAPKKEQHNYFGLGNYTENAGAGVGAGGGSSGANEDTHATVNLRINLSKETTSDLKRSFSLASTFPTNFGALKPNNFVLRQPRLQFDSLADRGSLATPTTLLNAATALTSTFPKALAQSFIEPKSPLSSTVATTFGLSAAAVNNNSSLATSSTCSVCGTPIHCVNLQQTRKYGGSACGACRKFILKITRSSTTSSLKALQLHCKGDGNCIISPYSKAHVKNFKKICKDRCSSCWLKKCLQTLQFPAGDKLRISAALPTSTLLKPSESKRDKDAVDTGVEMCTGRDIDPDGLSPTGLFGSARFKSWKLPLETAAENLKLNLKSNPLAENNATFGSSTLLRPAILEKPIFLQSLVESQQEKQEKHASTAGGINAFDKASQRAGIESGTPKATKSKRKEKDKEKCKEKDKEKERDTSNVKATTSNKNTATIATEAIPSTTTAATIKTTLADSEELTKALKPATLSTPVTAISTTPNTITTNSTVNSTNAPTTTTTITSSTTTTPSTTPTTTSASGDSVKRQRIDLKGPRVKHVCRSASIVLGQPLATFGEDEDEVNVELVDDSEPTSAPSNAAKENNETVKVKIAKIVIEETDDRAAGKEQPQSLQQQQPLKQNSPPNAAAAAGVKKPTIADNKAKNEIVEPAPKAAKIMITPAEISSSRVAEPEKPLPLQPPKNATRNSNLNNINVQIQRSSSSYATTFGKKYIRQFNSDGAAQIAQTPLQQRRKEPIKTKTLISIDFWENYDPAEVCQTGFGLIVTETVAQRALCFLCGSTGLDPLLFCACCCEPYHQYCVMDEYNLKHSSLDDTMASLLDNTTLPHNASVDQFSQLTNRLNWLCPRCTVCYTCNMSSGSKVKCQKCQKNYHSTCLGTSKRLLGADRPLICVNCLKCKSCSTTKVSKFVGNLPMCTVCFKLRKKGNYCPICQKCYDDNDFDLKMMECGDCKQWVHSKCEGLSDEQYNLLSTLPESIEFICKKCARQNDSSKQKAADWRHAVMEEFKTSLMSVLKLLSKSRQACALLKLSPRKKVRCTCGQNSGSNGNSKIQPKSLQFNGVERDTLGSDGESQCSDDVYEFKEKLSDERSREKCTCLLKSNATPTANSYYTTAATSSLSLVDIKRKINNSEYVSLAEFNYDMNMVIQSANCDELVISYKEILSEQFPWFQNETKACTDALEEDMFESCSYALNNAMDTQPDFVDEEQDRSVIDLPDDIEDVIYSLKSRTDTRVCLFCRKTGEGMSNEESRLLYCGHDCWVHTNCAMWSAEVFEEIDGSLQNVHSAVSRGRMIKCTVCGNRGATVGCNVKACGEHYHYPCARGIECAFLTDKTMYCPEHAKGALKSNSSATIETNFEVSRPVYVELDRKPKKCLEPTKVQFHIGSLEVKQLGTVLPRFSDSFEAIVPINFLCSRLYWSSKEPWKIVEYTVRTTIQNSFSTLTTLDMGRNFTVDHTNPNVSMVQLGLAQIAHWHSSLARGELMDLEPAELASMRSSTLTKLLPEYLTHSQNSSSATDENTEEEPQTNADLLPPEIKEAIFEDLPHELLDGISMLDIFPKFMIYEEMGNSDGKTEMFLNEQSKDGVVSATVTTSATTAATSSNNVQVSDEDSVNSSFSKQLELSNSWSSSNLTLGHVEDTFLSCTRSNAQVKRAISVSANELQRNKADILKKTTQQRAWAKLDGATAAIKKRKLSKALPELRVAEGVLLSLSQQRAKTKETAAVVAAAHRQSVSNSDLDTTSTLRTKTFTWSAAKRYIEPSSTAAATATEKKDDTKIKLMQVDGVDDSITEYRIISGIGNAQFNGTVKCDRCHCTYRSYESFQRHLATCEPLSTSESESEAAPRSPDTSNSTSPLATADGVHDLNKLRQGSSTLTSTANGLPFIQAFSQAIPIGNIQANINGIPIANMQTGVQGLQNIQGLQNLSSLQNIQLQSLQPQALGGNFFISQAAPTTSAADELQFLSNSLQSLTANLNGTYTLAPTTGFGTATVQATQQQPQLFTISAGPDGTQQIIQLPTTQPTSNPQLLQGVNATFQTLQTSNSDKKIVLPMAGKPIKTVATKSAQQTATAAKNKLKTSGAAATVKPIQSKMNASAVTQQNLPQPASTPITVLNATNTNQLLNQNLLQQMQAAGLSTGPQQPQLLFQTTNGAGQQQPIVMQQLGATSAAMPQNIISFVTTDGSQTPQVQYLTIPTTNDFKPQAQTTPFITAAAAPNTNALMQGAFLQTDASGNLMLTTTQPPSGLQMLSATPLNITAQQQPQVIGTLIQPQTLQLGGNVIATTGGDPQQQQQVIIGGGATGLEMINATAPQVILATQPMYYGLETIVQNTVMSSQQFVSTAMPGVLSQNASFSATTTQVFQASKIEPLVDIPAGYVVLNNVDAGPSLVQQPHGTQQSNYLNATAVLQQQQQQQQGNMAQQAGNNADQQSIFRIHTSTAENNTTGTPTMTTSFQYQPQQQLIEPTMTLNQPQANVQIVTAKVPPVAQVKRSNAVKATPVAAVTKVQPQVVNKVLPTTVLPPPKVNNSKLHQQQQQQHNYQRNIAVTSVAEPKTSIHSSSNNNNNNTYVKVSATTALPTFTSGGTTTTQVFSTISPAISAAIAKPLPNATAGGRKTNLIRPINKAEVKPKVMKAPAAVAVAKQLPPQQTKMAMLKPQPQPQLVQQTPSQPPLYQTELVASTHVNNSNISNKLLEYNVNVQQPSFAEAQDAQAPQQQQPYNSIYTANGVQQEQQQQQQQLSNGHAMPAYDVHQQQQQQQQQIDYEAEIPYISELTSVGQQQQQQLQQQPDLLPPTHTGNINTNNNHNNTNANRCLQYSNSGFNQHVPTNIVNPIQQSLQQYTSTTTTQQHNTSTTLISRPTNRVLPMQQRQESMSSSTALNTKTTATATKTVNSNHNKIYNNDNSKMCYEATEVKKEQQMLEIMHATQQQQQQQQQQVLRVQQQQHEVTMFEKSLSPEDYDIGDSLKCDLAVIESETSLSTTCQQVQQMVEHNLPRYTGSCLMVDEKQKMLDATAEPYGHIVCNGNGRDINGANELGDNGDYNDDVNTAMDNDDNTIDDDVGDDDEVDDDDDDGFSLKMPTEDGDHDMSDSDEPAVKEKISKILDNLTNEDCTDSMTTATTVEAAKVELAAVHYMDTTPPLEGGTTLPTAESATEAETEAAKYANETSENFETAVTAEETAAVAAAASEYITQMAEDMGAQMVPSLVEETNFELQKLEAKLSPHVALDTKPLDAAATEAAIVDATTNPETNSQEEIAVRKSTPPHPHPQRDPKKITGPHLLYEIQSEDGFTYKSTSIADVWEKVFEAVQVARRAHGLAPLPEGPLADMSGVQMIGLKTNALKYLIEQLPGVEKCSKYTPKYHKRTAANATTTATAGMNVAGNSSSTVAAAMGAGVCSEAAAALDYCSDQDELQENPYESARCEPYSTRSEYDMFSWLASKHRKQPIQVFVQPSDTELIPRRGTGSNLPMAMKYRTLKETYKDYVGVFRSHIHGRGLYCTKDIEAGEMVIEYAGELIRSTLTDKRERNYDSRGIGCYMFKIDDNLVVDATMRGNAARFINHSCEPNCYSKVVDILGHKHIIIFALRRIVQGEELTYDYKFPFEDEKIPCSCGSKKCRKYLN